MKFITKKFEIFRRTFSAQVACNICGWKGREFKALVAPTYKRENAQCPKCGSLERHRGLIYYFNSFVPLKKNMRILDFAPIPLFRKYFEAQGCRYMTADLFRKDVDVMCDLQSLPFRDGTLDMIICYHLLEHVENDAQAITEMYRILKSGGVAYIQVGGTPLNKKETIEFGKPDPLNHNHMRIYGTDIVDRISAQGFFVDQRDFSTYFGKKETAHHGFEKACYPTFVCTKPQTPESSNSIKVWKRQALTEVSNEKKEYELLYWRERRAAEGTLDNSWYHYFYTEHFGLMDSFFTKKKILDIGSGPRGSLEWADMAAVRIGLDPLAEHYRELGTEKHRMQYVASGSEKMPFPDGTFDVVTSFNSLDHVHNLDQTIREIKRVLKPGGLFLLLTDVNHKPTKCEPISFSWDIVDRFTDLLKVEDVKQYEKKIKNWMYDSIRANVAYDHSNKADRYGILSAKYVKREGAIRFPFVSVVIPVYNATATLPLCLESLADLDYPGDLLEVIVVDNGSTDGSPDLAKKFGVSVLYETSMQSSYAARNKGIREANGDLIAFTDSDCIVTPKWLRYLVKEWDDPSVGCFAGEIESYRPETLIERFSDRAQILRQKGTLNNDYLPYTQTANSAYRKEVFDKVGLFIPEMVSGGDADIAWRMQKQLGLKIKFVPEALVYHKHRVSIGGLYRQFKKYEHGKVLWKKYYPDYPLRSIGQRSKDLGKALEAVLLTLPGNMNSFLQKRIDRVDLAAPFLRLVIYLGTFIGRCK